MSYVVNNNKLVTYNGKLLNGNIIIVYNDWFLPSIDELNAMYTNLKAVGVGGFLEGYYWSSTEANSDRSGAIYFGSGGYIDLYSSKGNSRAIRACRSFNANVGAYNLRDIGPAGGLIFYIDGGTTYYEASPNNLGQTKWSNITNIAVGTTGTVVSTGKQNTLDIINQPGHTTSAAKVCSDLSI